MKLEKYYRAFGVYGICSQEGKLLVIKKSQGPYINRYDLPGGQLEEGENLLKGIHREFFEGTGFYINVKGKIGVVDFILPWQWRNITHLHHIALFYLVSLR